MSWARRCVQILVDWLAKKLFGFEPIPDWYKIDGVNKEDDMAAEVVQYFQPSDTPAGWAERYEGQTGLPFCPKPGDYLVDHSANGIRIISVSLPSPERLVEFIRTGK